MEGDSRTEFEPDAYLEKLLRLRASDTAQFNVLPKAVREIVEQYEGEKEATQAGKPNTTILADLKEQA